MSLTFWSSLCMMRFWVSMSMPSNGLNGQAFVSSGSDFIRTRGQAPWVHGHTNTPIVDNLHLTPRSDWVLFVLWVRNCAQRAVHMQMEGTKMVQQLNFCVGHVNKHESVANMTRHLYFDVTSVCYSMCVYKKGGGAHPFNHWGKAALSLSKSNDMSTNMEGEEQQSCLQAIKSLKANQPFK